MKYIVLDVHPLHIFVVVVDEEGTCLYKEKKRTSAQVVIQIVEMFSGQKLVVIEETDIAAWLVRVLREHGHEVLVADPVENAWIAKDENIDDMEAALKLAELARAGLINPVHHPQRKRARFKQLVMYYHQCSEELARAKNKLNSHLRSEGLYPLDSRAYAPPDENPWLSKLDDGLATWKAEMLLDRVLSIEQQKQQVRERLIAHAHKHDEIVRFMGIPGIGPIRAATFFAIIDTPKRFETPSKLCSYCGVGISRKRSDQTIGPPHLTWKCNPRLKDAAMGAARSAITCADNKYRRKYEAALAKGKADYKARADVARSIVLTLRAMWLSGERYIPGKDETRGRFRSQSSITHPWQLLGKQCCDSSLPADHELSVEV